MHYRKMIPVPPPVPSRPTLMEQIWAYSEKVRKNMAFWWRFNNESVYGGIAVCVFLMVFLVGCYGIASDAITFGPCCSTNSHHHFHRSFRSSRRFRRR